MLPYSNRSSRVGGIWNNNGIFYIFYMNFVKWPCDYQDVDEKWKVNDTAKRNIVDKTSWFDSFTNNEGIGCKMTQKNY